jgi:alginate O-acetyltransferase complex protein AlgI
MPYSALSIAEFWRRWHISLSTWLRDYLYIPLGGNRGSSAQTYRNLLITMLLGGLWHGAGWNFLIWGALHGIALAIQRAWSRAFPWRLPAPAGWVLTMAVVLIGWIFFRAQGLTAAWTYLSKVVTWSGGARSLSPQIFAAIASLAIAHLLSRKDGNWSLEIIEKSAPVRTLVYAGMIFLLATLASADATPFIYFQF